MIIDCHGHCATSSEAVRIWRNRRIAWIESPEVAGPAIGGDRAAIATRRSEPARLHTPMRSRT
jgi:hypothetical protein